MARRTCHAAARWGSRLASLVKSNFTASLDLRFYPFDHAFGLGPAHFLQRYSRSKNEGIWCFEANTGVEWPRVTIDGQQTAVEAAPVARPSIRYEPAPSRKRVHVQSMIPNQGHAAELDSIVASGAGLDRIDGDAAGQRKCRKNKSAYSHFLSPPPTEMRTPARDREPLPGGFRAAECGLEFRLFGHASRSRLQSPASTLMLIYMPSPR